MLEQSVVRIWQDGAVVGMGFVVGARHIITCAHVIDNTHPQKRPSDDITFDFPLLPNNPTCTGMVVVWKPRHATATGITDVAGIQLLEGETFPQEAQPLTLIPREQSASFPLRLYGWPRGSKTKGEWVGGDDVPFQMMGGSADGRWRVDLHQAQFSRVQEGFSGTAVYDPTWQAAIGMVVEVATHQPTFYMITARMLAEVWPSVITLSEPPVSVDGNGAIGSHITIGIQAGKIEAENIVQGTQIIHKKE